MTPDPAAILHDVYDTEFGLRPTSTVIKPVHVANGLARSLTGRAYRTSPLADSLRRWVRNQRGGFDEERNPNEKILERYGTAFTAADGSSLSVAALNDLRSLMRDVLAADDAVFPDEDKSSYTLSNERFITRDPSDLRAGQFLARLLESGSAGDAAETVRLLLTTEDDPWTTLALPLLELCEPREEAPTKEALALISKSESIFVAEDGRLADPVLGRLRETYDRLARFERQAGSKLNSLRRLVLFGCFCIHVHFVHRWSTIDDATAKPPILLDLFDGSRVPIRDASRATVRAGGDAVEGLIIDRIRASLTVELGSKPKESAAREIIEASAGETALVRFQVHSDSGAGSPLEAAVQTLVELGLERVGHPANYLTELGRRAGYMTPWANEGRGGRQLKRYGATAEFLETLVAATVEPDEPLEFHEFLDTISDSFGIVVGRPQDDDAIRHNNLRGRGGAAISISEEDLRLNVEELRRLIEETGYAKSYADGRTIVTSDPERTRV